LRTANIAFAILAVSQIAWADVYKCRDSKGKISYSSSINDCPQSSVQHVFPGGTPSNQNLENAVELPSRIQHRNLLRNSQPQETQYYTNENKSQPNPVVVFDASNSNDAEAAAEEAYNKAAKLAEEQAQELRDEIEEKNNEAREAAEDAAELIRANMLLSEIKSRNGMYFLVTLLFIGGYITYILINSRKDESMSDDQKYGIATTVISLIMALLAIIISDDWNYNYDFFGNLMTFLDIRLIEYEGSDHLGMSIIKYVINIPTKYVILIAISFAAYGFTTYLGITKAIRPWVKD